MRAVPFVVAAALVLAGCDVVEEIIGDPTPTAPGAEGTGPGGTDPGNGDQPGGETTAPSGTPINDLGGLGSNGPAMLRGDRARLVIEVDVQQGARTDQAALDHLRATIDRYADKPGGVVFAGGNTFESDRTAWGVSDLRAVAEANRSQFSTGDTMALYVLYVRGGFVREGGTTNAIGVAHNASEMALFPDRWAGLGSLVGSDRAIERAVLVHEWGHMLGLINITYQSEIDHEDPENPHHSSNPDSVMYWAVETDLVTQVLGGSPPDDFDDADRADIELLRARGG